MGQEQSGSTHDTELRATARPSLSSLIPESSAPESREARMGGHRNGAYKETVSVREAHPQEETQRRRQMMTMGLEVGLAVAITFARQIWGWAHEEQVRARVDRDARRRMLVS